MADDPGTVTPSYVDKRDGPTLQHKVSNCINGDARNDCEANGDDDRAPRVGQTFKTYGEACYYYKEYAQRSGFGATVRNSLFTKSGVCTKLVLACSKCRKARGEPLYSTKTDCPASIRFRLQGDGLLHLVIVKLEHNHPLNPSMKEKCYRKLSNSKVRRPNRLCHDLIKDEEELLSFQKDCEITTQRGHMKLGQGNVKALNEFFTRMQIMNVNFFCLVDLDDEGCLRNVFWADPISRAAYQHFCDVVSFDTTCFINKGDMNLVLFLGVNHHGQPVLLGCGLLSDETTETYVWLFKAWLACMFGRQPDAIVTDQCKPIQDAVARVFPEARHRFCLWNLMRKMPEKVRGFGERDAIKSAFKKAVYDSLTAGEFERDWRDMIEKFGLEHSEWFKLLYENRQSWVPVFIKEIFWAGICDTKCCQSMANFFEGFVNSETSLSEFLGKYEAAVQSKYEKEAQADYDSFHKTQPLVSKFYMEEQLSKLYTYNMFMKFQDELKATMYCDVSLVKIDGSMSTFDVKESVFLEDGIETEIRKHEVLYDENESQVQCICGFFQLQGILCRHALSVLKLQQVFEIPSQYIVIRWRKDYKQWHALSHSSNDFLADNLMERYGYLSMRCLQLVDLGVLSDEKYQLALELIREVEKHLLGDSTGRDEQSKSICSNSRSNGSTKNCALPQSATSMGDKIIGSLQVKRRGRPPKKRKELDIAITNGSNNVMDSSIALISVNQSNVVQVATSPSHLEGQTRTQRGIDLMEDVNRNTLSFSSLLVHASSQRCFGNQLGMQFRNIMQVQGPSEIFICSSRMNLKEKESKTHRESEALLFVGSPHSVNGLNLSQGQVLVFSFSAKWLTKIK